MGDAAPKPTSTPECSRFIAPCSAAPAAVAVQMDAPATRIAATATHQRPLGSGLSRARVSTPATIYLFGDDLLVARWSTKRRDLPSARGVFPPGALGRLAAGHVVAAGRRPSPSPHRCRCAAAHEAASCRSCARPSIRCGRPQPTRIDSSPPPRACCIPRVVLVPASASPAV